MHTLFRSFFGSVFLLLLVFAPTGIHAQAEGASDPIFLVFNYDSMVQTRSAIKNGDPRLLPSYQRLIDGANAVLNDEPLSVLTKQMVAASEDKHDYFDIGNYSWPNPDTKDGLPYIRRDGERNPEAQGDQFDKKNFNVTLTRVRQMALAWFYSGDQRYVEKGADFLRVWFVDPETRMNPNMRHAAALPGVSDGSAVGIINTAALIHMLDSVKLLSLSEDWCEELSTGLKQWFAQYNEWLLGSEFGMHVRARFRNNIGTWYAAQVAAYALYSGQSTELIREMVALGRSLIDHQVAADGSMPAEIRRTRPMAYSRYALQAFIPLARAGMHINEDLWSYQTADGRSLQLAFKFIIPYLLDEKRFDHGIDIMGAQHYSGSVQLVMPVANVFHFSEFDRAVQILNPLNNALAQEGALATSQAIWLRGYLQFD